MPADGEQGKVSTNAVRMATNYVGDYSYFDNVATLKRLRSYVLQEAALKLPDDFELGKINLVRYRIGGREATEDEWREVESKTRQLIGLLNDKQRAQFSRGGIPSWVINITLVMVASAAASLIVVYVARLLSGMGAYDILIMPAYLIWALSLGATGSVAFIGMNALALQEDITFDVSNNRLLILRIVLGSLFSLILTLPFGFPSFKEFIEGFVYTPANKDTLTPQILTQSALLLMPFILGFSTPLVIMILNRFVDAIQSFFGKVAHN